jgi:hypothetical protein
VRYEVENGGYPRYGQSSLRRFWGNLERFSQARPPKNPSPPQSGVQTAGCGTRSWQLRSFKYC